MKQIFLHGKLGNGKYTLVDDEDFDKLNQYHWFFAKEGYVKRISYIKNGKRKSIYMHRLIMNTLKGMIADHKDDNPLNNQKYNLRNCTNQQSVMNRGKQKNNTSGYKGVRELKDQPRIKKWLAYIRFNRKTKCLGLFLTKLEAAKVYNQKAKELFGEFARLNVI